MALRRGIEKEATGSLGGLAKTGSFFQDFGTSLVTNLLMKGVDALFGLGGEEEVKPARQHKPIKQEAAQNLLGGGPAQTRHASGLQGMRPGAVQDAAGNLYKQKSPYTG